MSEPSYFRRLSATRFQPTEHVMGAWSMSEQHIAPTIGLLTHIIEKDRDGRRDDGLRVGRVGCEILGVLTMDPVEVEMRVIRAGRTIELVEAELSQTGRTAVVARAWLLQRSDTAALEGTALDAMPAPEEIPPFDFGKDWPGGYVRTIDPRRILLGTGRAQCWLQPLLPLLDTEETSPTARLMGVIDPANGMAPRADPAQVFFPNVDLFASLFRDPEPGWVGLDVRASFGPDGTGITETVVHDEHGPVGTMSQTLTVRVR